MDSTLHSWRQVRSTASRLSGVRAGGIGARSRGAGTGPARLGGGSCPASRPAQFPGPSDADRSVAPRRGTRIGESLSQRLPAWATLSWFPLP